jgi:RNA polymerase sigma-70 factor (ECF subfamily)
VEERAREAAWLARAREGDRVAFEELVKEAFPPLVRFCGSIAGRGQAMDLAQETVLKALRAVARFRGEARFRSWLFTIARNTWIKQRQLKRNRMEHAAGEMMDDRPARHTAPEAGLVREELRAALDRAIATLPESQRTALLLCDREELSYKEIAEVMGTPVGTVMSRIYYARGKLREQLGDVFRGL